MNYGYLRVSTEEQNLDNQKLAISQQYHVDYWVEEKRSGTLDYKKRSLGDLLNRLQAGDTLIITELSRLGRSLTMVFNIVNILKEKKVRLIAIKNNYDMKPNDPNDIVTSVLLFAFGLSAQIERELISERTKQGLAAARARGKQIGKRKGQVPYYTKLRNYQQEILEKRDGGRSVLSLAIEYGVTWKTMKTFLTKGVYMKAPPALADRPQKHGHPSRREIAYYQNMTI
jgi:DNA invertase Pin-like site-specific DNA recombinase